MFRFLDMIGNYEERKVDRYEKEGLLVDTAAVNDSDKPFETAVACPAYNNGKWVIVELYNTKKQAQAGHNKWVKKMTAKTLPKNLKDVSTAEIATFCDVFGKEWRNSTVKNT